MPKLVATRGGPGVGKSTYAKKWVQEDIRNRVRVNRDSIREMMNEGWYSEECNSEKTVLQVRNAIISTLLKSGKDVIVDDTNLPQRVVRDLLSLADRHQAQFSIADFTDVPLEVALDRNSQRSGKERVPDEVIRDMYKRFLKGRSLPLPYPERETLKENPLVPYSASESELLPGVYLCDIDGTVATMCDRSPFDESRVSEDTPNHDIVDLIKHLIYSGEEVIFISARTDACYNETMEWLLEHAIPTVDYMGRDIYPDLFMRPSGDKRKDRNVKLDLFNEHIRGKYRVKGVFDDRDQVVDMWRELGLTCLQVAKGDF